jgi:peptidoglycan/xylan/chitin deacetylase (PgdA/CDA1 family)
MPKSRHLLKWAVTIGVTCFLVLGFNNYYVKPDTGNSSKAYAEPLYAGENDDAYALIQQEKSLRMLKNVVSQYRKGHPPISKPQPKKTVSQKVNKQSTAIKPAIPLPIPNGPRGSHIVYLTIDDGPSLSTETILNILNQYHVTATFFMLEPNVRKYPTAVKTLANEGFGIGLHGVTHDKKKFYQSTSTVVGEMKTDQDTLLNITGIKTPLIRVPYGSVPYMTSDYRAAEVQAGFIMWDWNVDSKDWFYKDQRYVANTIQQLEKMKGKNESPVILIHDLPTTAQYLPQLLDYLKKNHYEFRRIDPSLSPVQFR